MAQARGAWPPTPEPLPHPVTDNHTHLDLADSAAVSEPREVADLLAAAAAVNVPRAVQIGCDLPAARWTAQAVQQYPQLVGGVAIHPNEAPRLAQRGELDAALTEIADLLRGPRMRVVGETGLDTFRTGPDGAAAQLQSFRAHIAMAKELDLPLQIHNREAHAAVLDTLARDGAPQRTVFHCFSGDAEMARFCAAQGWYLSFAGPVTFRNAEPLRQALREVPLNQVLVETDAPYLTPHPHRGAANASYLLPITVRAIAAVKNQPLPAVCQQIEQTSQEIYGPW